VPAFDNSGSEPLTDQSQDLCVADSVFKESHHPSMIDGIEECLDVCIEHLVHALCLADVRPMVFPDPP
jgi:hypothetical protein